MLKGILIRKVAIKVKKNDGNVKKNKTVCKNTWKWEEKRGMKDDKGEISWKSCNRSEKTEGNVKRKQDDLQKYLEMEGKKGNER